LIDPVYNPDTTFYVSQPGSSVATSLCAGEAVPKYPLLTVTNRHVGLLSITGKEFHMEKIRLTTIRPFVMREIVLEEQDRFKSKASDKSKDAVIKFLTEQVPLPPFAHSRSKNSSPKQTHNGKKVNPSTLQIHHPSL
jgi:double-strand break repair protein MRE11